jgi:dihydropteroate synthase
MHMQGEPRTMQAIPATMTCGEVNAFLLRERAQCIAAGIAAEAIALDPGIGFGKGLEHNSTLLKGLREIWRRSGSPLLVGVSRKSLIGRMLGRGRRGAAVRRPRARGLAVSMGARVLRTHDVAPTRDAIRMVSAVLEGRVN